MQTTLRPFPQHGDFRQGSQCGLGGAAAASATASYEMQNRGPHPEPLTENLPCDEVSPVRTVRRAFEDRPPAPPPQNLSVQGSLCAGLTSP